MNTATIQQINNVEGNLYQLLFANVVDTYGVVLVGLNVSAQDIMEGDIRIGDTVTIGQNSDGLYVKDVDLSRRAPNSEQFFPPEPPPRDEYISVLVGPLNLKDANVDLRKTIPLTIRGVLDDLVRHGTVRASSATIQVAIGDDDKDKCMSDIIAATEAMCTESGS